MRSGGYSVFKVKQGGYFFVFYDEIYENDNQSKSKLVTCFTAYLNNLPDEKSFEQIEQGKSTAKDVKQIDENCELMFLMSNGTYSYSLLKNNKILQIKYDRNVF